MKKLFLLLGLIVINCSVLFAEEITITTYYPSPYGSYDELTANKMKIGSNYSAPATVFVDDSLLVEGQVGIGTSTPAATVKLDVAGTENFGVRYLRASRDARIAVGDPTRTWSWATGWATAGDFSLIEEGVSGNRIYVQKGTGNVGIGTSTPARTLHVNGSAVVASSNRSGKLDLGTDAFNYVRSDNNGLYLGAYFFPAAGGDDWVTVRNGSGNVGIGIPNPAYNLQVVGTAAADTVRASSFIASGSTGITRTFNVRNSAGTGSCSVTVVNGIITGTSC
ncbi:MAG: hypothetical protein COV71_01310 [Candidatus Omnitrophica bacterium CG11_big_fil_rev_8_21_14_0_20_41_12]|nr:MAG: hypothetical protein COV71_01310 [Candidatus Omnitrophica bacterium CG11_big_fil_rev_8_21_14_0_20_41_12]